MLLIKASGALTNSIFSLVTFTNFSTLHTATMIHQQFSPSNLKVLAHTWIGGGTMMKQTACVQRSFGHTPEKRTEIIKAKLLLIFAP
jgi:hypothetical protein